MFLRKNFWLLCGLLTAVLAVGAACDADRDGSFDTFDNCPTTANSNQFDSDLDGLGDVCDNCPSNANADQADQDRDGRGAACDVNDLNPLI